MSSLVDTRSVISPWKTCVVCRSGFGFKTPREFTQHLRDFHCSKEGGSFVCRYGMNGVCPSLPLEGVSDRDYDDHVSRDHVYCDTGGKLFELSNCLSISHDDFISYTAVSFVFCFCTPLCI